MIHIDPMHIKRNLEIQNGDKFNFSIGCIGVNSYINSLELNLGANDEVINVQIGNFSSIAYNVLALVNRNHDYKSVTTSSVSLFNFKDKKIRQKGQIIIGNDAWIGNNVILLSGIKIGNGAVIGAGTVVSKDVPPYAIAVGNPMRIIKYRFSKENIEKFQNIQWWNWEIDDIKKNIKWFEKSVDEFTNKFYIEKNNSKELKMIKKEKSILFYPDFNENYPVWEKVIYEYISKFTAQDDITLILRIPNDEDFEQKINMISEIIDGNSNLPDILVLNDIVDDERDIFRNVNYFITTRCMDTVKCIEMADEFYVRILSGVDTPVFDV